MAVLFIFTLENINIINLWVKAYGIQLNLESNWKGRFSNKLTI